MVNEDEKDHRRTGPVLTGLRSVDDNFEQVLSGRPVGDRRSRAGVEE